MEFFADPDPESVNGFISIITGSESTWLYKVYWRVHWNNLVFAAIAHPQSIFMVFCTVNHSYSLFQHIPDCFP